jgi:hypothetical protein
MAIYATPWQTKHQLCNLVIQQQMKYHIQPLFNIIIQFSFIFIYVSAYSTAQRSIIK